MKKLYTFLMVLRLLAFAITPVILTDCNPQNPIGTACGIVNGDNANCQK